MTKENPGVVRDRLAGSLVGLLVGDALGVPYEFHPPAAIPPPEQIEFAPPAGFRRAHSSVPPGTWSDDGAQALVLLHSLLACNGIDLDHFSKGLSRWRNEGFCAVDGNVFDVGIQTSTALARLAAGTPPTRSGPNGERDNGNGSLMRVLPLARWHQGSDEELARLAGQQSLPTHGHPRAQIACALYCLWIRAVLEDASDPWEAATQRLRAIATTLSYPATEVDIVLNPANAVQPRGTGYVVDALWSARAAVVSTSNFEDCVRAAIALGNDTDTTAAIAGGVAGAIHGLAEIPSRWRHALRGGELLTPLMAALLESRSPMPSTASVARTSDSHPIQVATVRVLNGRIGITFCPGKKQRGAMSGDWDRDLDTDLMAIREWGADHLITLIEDHEMTALAVEALPCKAAVHGMQWHHLPIVDGQAPDAGFERQWTLLMPQLRAALEAGASVVIHCKGGLGRAGTVAARLLLACDPQLPAGEAMKIIREIRPRAIETLAQEQHLLCHR